MAGVWREFGGPLYPRSETYAEVVGRAAGYFVKVGLAGSHSAGLKLARGLHYESLYEDVLAPKERGPQRGSLRRADEVDARLLRDKVEKLNRDYASIERPGTIQLEADVESTAEDFAAAVENRDLVDALRRKFVETAGRTRRQVLDILLARCEAGEEPMVTGVARELEISHQSISVHVKGIRKALEEIVQSD